MTREEAIDVLKHNYPSSCFTDLCEAVDIAIEALSAQPEQRWIPWNSGMFPEKSGTYTVTAYDKAIKRVTYAKYQKRLKRWELTGARAYWRVIAWMPLPAPYRTEGDDNHDELERRN